MSQLIQSEPRGLSSIQELVKEDVDLVATELRRIVVSDFELIDQVNEHLIDLGILVNDSDEDEETVVGFRRLEKNG